MISADQISNLLNKISEYNLGTDAKNINKSPIQDPIITERNPKKTLLESDYIFYIKTDEIKKELNNNGIKTPNNILMEPNIEGPDFTISTKEIFDLNKDQYTNIMELAEKIHDILNKNSEKLELTEIKKIGPFINVNFENIFFEKTLHEIINNQALYGTINTGDKKFLVEYCSPNIAKQMTIGHLRSTILGKIIQNLLDASGKTTYNRNYYGDRGTPFGKVIFSLLNEYKKNQKIVDEIIENPTQKLGTIYSNFGEIEDENKSERAKYYFKLLEDGDDNFREIWQIIRELSIKDFEVIINKLNINFEINLGESYTEKFIEEAYQIISNNDFLIKDEGAELFKLRVDNTKETGYSLIKNDYKIQEEDQIEPYLIKKSDGSTLYSLRDIALGITRNRKLGFENIIYVVGNEQRTHFAMLKTILEDTGAVANGTINYVGFGLILKDGQKMSSRKGDAIRLGDLIKSIENKIGENFPNTEKSTQEKLSISALIFNDIKNDRIKDINFDLEQMSKLSGEGGIYLQYTKTRILGLTKKIEELGDLGTGIIDNSKRTKLEKIIIKKIGLYPSFILRSVENYKPHVFAQYVSEICRLINRRYDESPKITSMENKNDIIQNKFLIDSINIFFNNSLEILSLPKIETI